MRNLDTGAVFFFFMAIAERFSDNPYHHALAHRPISREQSERSFIMLKPGPKPDALE